MRRGASDPTLPVVAHLPHTPRPRHLEITEHVSPADGTVIVGEARGPGSDWTLEALPALLGADDDPVAFVPWHQAVARAHRKHAGLRLH
ncbi:hypothetical protein ABZT23_21430 [Streptomyces sp. NPDC005386]|uniref:hypothetical protein n=1 Tax=Streptomyces sp. NPDC005386 TaxID=3154562 RepID=UPI0033A8D31C